MLVLDSWEAPFWMVFQALNQNETHHVAGVDYNLRKTNGGRTGQTITIYNIGIRKPQVRERENSFYRPGPE